MKFSKEAIIVLIMTAIITGILTAIGNLTEVWPITSFSEYLYITLGAALVVGVSSSFRRKMTRGTQRDEK